MSHQFEQEQPAAQANAELDLYAIELERGIGIKASKSLEDAWRIAEQEAEQRNLEIVDVRLADEEDIEWVRSMGGHIPRLPDPADSKGNI